ncbi:5'-methylthioadenosine/S-adenosylhomocysteine nucleosidase [Paenibacillus borealis]|uniref:5'-methylthioadenosine/S-adenosylhomocysteine nucleosidase n=1 Tax=Paenibacillus borealis TaxID=160799 RepID=UPI002116EA8A|nr:5'-methylthioadenosine/S-adenosylhomocysteine nucleosidase [Paenibacillus borealis]
MYAGKMISGEEFIASSEKRKRLDSFGAMCVDMESASIAQNCYVNHIPFVVIRSISDHADEESVESFETHVESGSLNALCLVEKLLVSLHKQPLI